MNDIEMILRHMFHSKYVFFRPLTIAQHTHLQEKRVTEIIESMVGNGVVDKTSNNDNILYFLTPASTWILRNMPGWRR